MTALVLLEFDASGIKQPSRSAVAAAGLREAIDRALAMLTHQ